MDKIARLRQEIERRINILTNVYDEQVERKDEEMMNYYHGKVIALEELRPFLDIISEKPDKSLEEEMEEFFETMPVLEHENIFDVTFQKIARHFAEWQKSQMLKDAVEGEAEELYNDGESQCVVSVGTYFKPGEKVYVLKAEEE